MFLKLFKRNTPFDYPVLLFYTFIVHGILFFKPGIQFIRQHSIFNSIFDFYVWDHFSFNTIITLSVFSIFILSLFFNRLINVYGFFQVQTLLPAYLFVTLSGIFPESAIISPALICFAAVLWIMFELFKLFDLETVVQKLFYISFFIGILNLIYYPFGYYIFFILISVPIIKTPKLRELLIIPIGYLSAFYLPGLYFYGNGHLDQFIQIIISNFYLPEFQFSFKPQASLFSVFYLIILITISYINFKWQASNILVRFIRYYNVLFLFFIVTLFIVLFIPANRLFSGYYFILPVSVYLSNFFYDDKRRRLKEVLFIILLIAIAFSQYSYYSF